MNSLLGIIFHSIGGFASGSFYIPMNFVRKWSWESAWMILGLAAWIGAPSIMAWITVPELTTVLFEAQPSVLVTTMLFGVMWGVGNLTFGLSIRYLGISLGMTIALGITTAFGTLIPPIVEGTFIHLLTTTSGLVTFGGVMLSLVGIVITGRAGFLKEKDLGDKEKKASVKEFDLMKGLTRAIIAGVLSAGFAFGLSSGKPIAEIAVNYGVDSLYQNNAVLVWILWGGFISNVTWIIILNIKNRTYKDYTNTDSPLSKNYLWAMVGGVTWYMQFFFYGMGSTLLGKQFEFASWSLHMASIILFSNMWGIYFKEWKGISKKTSITLYTGLSIIVISFIVIGLGGNIEH